MNDWIYLSPERSDRFRKIRKYYERTISKLLLKGLGVSTLAFIAIGIVSFSLGVVETPFSSIAAVLTGFFIGRSLARKLKEVNNEYVKEIKELIEEEKRAQDNAS